MTDEELTQFTALAKKFEPKDKDKIVTVLKADMHPVFQEVHDQGHSAATTKGKTDLKTATDKLTAAETKVTELEGQLEALGGKAPDLQALQKSHDKQLQDLKDKHKAKLETLQGELDTARIEFAQEQLVTELVGKYNVDQEYADTILAKKPEITKRFKFNEAKKLEVLQNGKDIPFAETDGQTGVKLLAAELAPTIDKKWINSKVNRGSGLRGTAGGDTGGNRYDDAMKEVEAKGKAKDEAAKTRTSGLDRLGGRA